ncbi:MAG: hypothetical protein RIS97_1402, partial [Pseudomonadota bacterium]
LAQRFGDVQVGREVAAFADDQFARRCVGGSDVQRGAQHFVEVDGGGVGGNNFTGVRTNQFGDLVASLLGHGKPAGGVPTADQADAPFLRHHLGDAGGGGSGEHAQRVAVQINHAGRQGELVFERS